jgi:hypothetical protein
MRRAAGPVIGVDAPERPPLRLDPAAANPHLVLNRSVTLQLRRISGVNDRAHQFVQLILRFAASVYCPIRYELLRFVRLERLRTLFSASLLAQQPAITARGLDAYGLIVVLFARCVIAVAEDVANDSNVRAIVHGNRGCLQITEQVKASST